MKDVTLHLGDCLEYMRTLPDGAFDAVVTDPPYGIGRDRGMGGGGVSGWLRNRTDYVRKYEGAWDDEKPDVLTFSEMLRIARTLIVWGGNYFTDLLPQSNKWLTWDKVQTMPSYSDCELAWTNLAGNAVKMFTYNGSGMMAVEKNRVHPTQKPLALMKWCIGLCTQPGETVFDPFMGSGTTGVACVQTGRRFVGCEIDPGYFKIAQRRIELAQMQPPLIEPVRTPAVQLEAFA